MKAWGMTTSIPVDRCDKNCPYCIVNMTGFVIPNPKLVEHNLETAYTWARSAEISFFMITSKREPILNIEAVCRMANRFREYTVEVQTNGIKLNRHPEYIDALFENGVNTIAFSIDNLRQLDRYRDMFAAVTARGMMVRICINLTDIIPVAMGFADIFTEIEKAAGRKRGRKTGNIRQLLFRNISIPGNIRRGKQYQWIKAHTDPERYQCLTQEFDRLIGRENKIPLRTLPFDGSHVWGHHGISVVFSDYCIQETNDTTDVRSLIYLEDGHLYTSWSDPASILF